MGTTWSASVVVPRRRDLRVLHDGIQHVLDGVVAQMSTWEAGSDISRYNRAPAGSWHALPPAFFHVVQAGVAVARASGGAFDPSVGPLVELWGFGPAPHPPRVPDADAVAAARARTGWQRLQLAEEGQRLLQPGGMALDLSGIAKGYAVDAVSGWLRGQYVASALVEVGGELLGYGHKPDGRPWRVLVESSPEEEADNGLEPRVLALDGLAVATSGDRWHSFEHAGRRYSHTFDPRRGEPVPRAAAAVTVLAGQAMAADAWATAMTVLGPDEGMMMAERQGLAVRFLARTPAGLRETLSPAFRDRLEPSA